MTTKQILAGIATLAVLGIGVFAYTNQSAAPEPVNTTNGQGEEETATQTYTSPQLGLTFDYPEEYTLESHDDGNGERSWTTLVLVETAVREEYEASGAKEGPPAIAVQVFDNVEELELEEWITTTSYSNYTLATDPELLQGEVDGEPARAYDFDGLYQNTAVVVAHEGKVYLFTAAWLTEEDRNLDEFGNILDSVTFN